MNRFRTLAHRVRASRPAVAASIGLCALLLSLAAPSLLSALGSLSGPVGCQSNVDFSDDVTDDFSDDVTDDVTEGTPHLPEDPCVLGPGIGDGDGDGDSGEDQGGGASPGDVDAGVVDGTPTFTG